MTFDFDIDLDNLYAGAWFGDKPGKKVCIRLCPPSKVNEFRKQATTQDNKIVLNDYSKKMEFLDTSRVDEGKFNELINDYCISDWDLKDKNGKLIECNYDNKMLILQDVRFLKFFKACVEELNEIAGVQVETETKNFESSQEG